jgi:hypothetical protein
MIAPFAKLIAETSTMPVHDWTRVDAGIFHAFHHGWIEDISRALNRGILPSDYYALPEQHAAGFGPDVLTLQTRDEADELADAAETGSEGGVLLAASKLQPIAETDLAFYRRKQNAIAVRHISGDRLVAMIEVVSPGNKASHNPLRAFVEKVAESSGQFGSAFSTCSKVAREPNTKAK